MRDAELPDLLYILSRLRERLLGREVTAERVREPVVLRFTVQGNLSLLLGRTVADVFRKSHFLVFRFEGLDLAVNPMLAGRFRLAESGGSDERSLGFALGFGDVELRYLGRQEDGLSAGGCKEVGSASLMIRSTTNARQSEALLRALLRVLSDQGSSGEWLCSVSERSRCVRPNAL